MLRSWLPTLFYCNQNHLHCTASFLSGRSRLCVNLMIARKDLKSHMRELKSLLPVGHSEREEALEEPRELLREVNRYRVETGCAGQE